MENKLRNNIRNENYNDVAIYQYHFIINQINPVLYSRHLKKLRFSIKRHNENKTVRNNIQYVKSSDHREEK